MKKLRFILILSLLLLLSGCVTAEQKNFFCLGASAQAATKENLNVLLMSSEGDATLASNCLIITDTQIEWAFDN